MNNIILSGFNPDPSICKKDDIYYIATSTFEWYPGVQIHATKDLVNYELVSRPLTTNLINLLGNDDSCGIWAPCLTYNDGLFWLVYTDVKQTIGAFKDTLNYVTTCDTIDGVWSSPVFLNSSGFDPSLFHDDDGRKYLLNMIYDHRTSGKDRFYGITIQEMNKDLKLIGAPHLITKGSEIGMTEGPHILKKDDYYYLILAEGGTSYNHCVTIMRSRSVFGKYELHPNNPIIGPNNQGTLHKTGHGDIFKYNDQWYLVYLASRPIIEKRIDSKQEQYCPLGRETAIQEISWIDNWPYIKKMCNNELPQSLKNLKKITSVDITENFNKAEIDKCFQFSRVPINEYMKIENNKLYLKGSQSLSSRFKKSLIAKRWESLNFETSTKIFFEPTSFQQCSGLVNYYNSDNYTCCGITNDDLLGIIVELFTVENGVYRQLEKKQIKPSYDVEIFCNVSGKEYTYSFKQNEIKYEFSSKLLSSKLSDDYIGLTKNANFTGAFTGIFAYDLSGGLSEAQFDYFKYIEKRENNE